MQRLFDLPTENGLDAHLRMRSTQPGSTGGWPSVCETAHTRSFSPWRRALIARRRFAIFGTGNGNQIEVQ
jgi:hypothetical protein